MGGPPERAAPTETVDLEFYLRDHLNLPRSGDGAGDGAACRRSQVEVRQREIGLVQDVESFATNLQLDLLVEVEILVDGEVHRLQAGSAQDVGARVTEYVLARVAE